MFQPYYIKLWSNEIYGLPLFRQTNQRVKISLNAFQVTKMNKTLSHWLVQKESYDNKPQILFGHSTYQPWFSQLNEHQPTCEARIHHLTHSLKYQYSNSCLLNSEFPYPDLMSLSSSDPTITGMFNFSISKIMSDFEING